MHGQRNTRFLPYLFPTPKVILVMHVRPVGHAHTLTVRPLTLAVPLGIGNWEGMKDLYYWHTTVNARISRRTAVLHNVSYIPWGDTF
jgi:hypothetical protein